MAPPTHSVDHNIKEHSTGGRKKKKTTNNVFLK